MDAWNKMLGEFLAFLTEVCEHYEKTAPTVCAYANDLYIRIGERTDHVRLSELSCVAKLREDGLWEHPNFAANRIYHLMARLGMDVTRQAGF